MSRTKKPCPGCGVVRSSRLSDKVCSECTKKLAQYEELKSAMLAFDGNSDAGAVPVHMPFYYELPHHKHNAIGTHNLNALFVDLALECGAYFQDRNLTPDSNWAHYSNVIRETGVKMDHFIKGQTGSRGVLVINKKTLHALRKFFERVVPYATAVYANGFDDGSNLLNRMIHGEIKAEDLNDAQLKARA